MVGPTFMMRLQPFDRRRMTGFAVGLSLCGDDNPAPFLFFLRREKSDAPVRLRASFPLLVPFFLRRICVPLTKKALVKGRRFPVRPVFISDPRVALLHPRNEGACLRFRSRTVIFGIAAGVRSVRAGRARVCFRSKRSEILLRENVQKRRRPARGGDAE